MTARMKITGIIIFHLRASSKSGKIVFTEANTVMHGGVLLKRKATDTVNTTSLKKKTITYCMCVSLISILFFVCFFCLYTHFEFSYLSISCVSPSSVTPLPRGGVPAPLWPAAPPPPVQRAPPPPWAPVLEAHIFSSLYPSPHPSAAPAPAPVEPSPALDPAPPPVLLQDPSPGAALGLQLRAPPPPWRARTVES